MKCTTINNISLSTHRYVGEKKALKCSLFTIQDLVVIISEGRNAETAVGAFNY